MLVALARCAARKTWRTLEPLHGMVYFVPEAAEAYARVGVTGRAGYFASRAAPMGAVPAEVVVSTFFNFNPDLVHAAIPAAWESATPDQLVAARFAAVDAAFDRLSGTRWFAPRRWTGPRALHGSRQTRRAAASRAGRLRRGTPRCHGRPSHTSRSGTRNPSYANTGAMGTSRYWSCTGSRGSSRW